eukprot:6206598-Pleurochrysis_carterae.AAC.1
MLEHELHVRLQRRGDLLAQQMRVEQRLHLRQARRRSVRVCGMGEVAELVDARGSAWGSARGS